MQSSFKPLYILNRKIEQVAAAVFPGFALNIYPQQDLSHLKAILRDLPVKFFTG